MTKTYRIDYLDDHRLERAPVVIFDLSRDEAMKKARSLSKKNCAIYGKHSAVYAIASKDGQDTGQRVYIDGFFSHADDQF